LGQPVSSIKDGESHLEPARSRNGQRQVTPDPYTQDNPHMKRNLGKQ
jgi:hypothetical protein